MKRFVRNIFVLTSVFYSTSTCQADESSKKKFAQQVLSSIDTKIDDFLKFFHVPGVAVGVVYDGDVVYNQGFGLRNVHDLLPMTCDTLMPVGSVTKPFTSFLLGQLVDQGVLHWDDPVVEHVPKFKLADPYTTYEITIRDFLTHISGYTRHDGCWFGATLPRSEIVRRFRYLEPAYGFRERFCYGNVGYMMAAHAAECATNTSWETLLQEYILNPLKMYDTTPNIHEMQASKDFSYGYRDSQKGFKITPLVNPYTIGPAGALNSNVNDLVKWLQLLTKKGKGLIQPETFKEIIKPQVVSHSLLNGRNGLEDIILMETYGLGWYVISYKNHEAVFHGGHIEGFSTNVMFFPREKIGIVVLSNKNYSLIPYMISCQIADSLLGAAPTGWIEKVKQLTNSDEPHYYNESDAHKAGKIDGTNPAHCLKNFVGIYENPGYGKIEVQLENNRLIALFNSLHLYLDHWHYDTFEISKENNSLELEGLKASFRNNFYGEIDSLVIPFEPQIEDIVFKKKKDERLFCDEYLKSFIGTYNYLGVNFVIEKCEKNLCVKAMGQPPFILFPEKDGFFSVIDYEGYTVQFLTDSESAITAVQLIQPNNSSLTAYKIKEK